MAVLGRRHGRRKAGRMVRLRRQRRGDCGAAPHGVPDQPCPESEGGGQRRVSVCALICVWFGSVRLGLIRFGSVRFDSVWFDSVRFRSVPFGLIRFGSVRCGFVLLSFIRLNFYFMTKKTIWFGSIRFGSVWFGLVSWNFTRGWTFNSMAKKKMSCHLVDYVLGTYNILTRGFSPRSVVHVIIYLVYYLKAYFPVGSHGIIFFLLLVRYNHK